MFFLINFYFLILDRREYIDFLRGPLSNRRLEILNTVLSQISRGEELTLDSFFSAFSPENHPLVYSGLYTENELRKFFTNSITYREKVPSVISSIAFVDFFADVFYGYDDDSFDSSIRNMFPAVLY